VTRLQTRLKTLGYYSGAVDGAYGSGTVAAVKKFQKAIGLDRTGVATVALQKKLFSAGAPYYEADEPEYEEEEEIYVLLSPGDTGERVKKLQRRLKALGWFDGAIGGNYLRKTTEAVKAFQKAINVKQTGTATVALQKKLFADSAPRKEQEPIPPPEPIYPVAEGLQGQRSEKAAATLERTGLFPTESYHKLRFCHRHCRQGL
jgi:peptidoglycan hydrolase-like protein with peptidoglycan-binding domain